MKSISDFWRSLCLGQLAGPEERVDFIPNADPNATFSNSSSGDVVNDSHLCLQVGQPTSSSFEPPQPVSEQAMRVNEQTASVVIFMPPPPIIHWPPQRSINEALSESKNSPLRQPDMPELASNLPVSAESAQNVNPPQTKEEYVAYAEEFVAKNIERFDNVTEESVKSTAERAAAQANLVAEELGLRPETTPGLVKLAFYDFVILCDDSSSMTSDPQHIPALKETLRRVAHFATILQPKGISIRFLNHDEGDGRRYDDLVNADDIAREVRRVPFNGLTRLGQVLDAKIVQPKIINKLASGKLERPVFVVIITDGQPTAEPFDSLRTTIRNCRDVLSRQSYRDAAVIFLISQIGNDADATTFLRSLETDPQISNIVFCSTENLAAKLTQFQSSQQDKRYTAWLIELFLAALEKQTNHS